jgi:hypothetical protein
MVIEAASKVRARWVGKQAERDFCRPDLYLEAGVE